MYLAYASVNSRKLDKTLTFVTASTGEVLIIRCKACSSQFRVLAFDVDCQKGSVPFDDDHRYYIMIFDNLLFPKLVYIEPRV